MRIAIANDALMAAEVLRRVIVRAGGHEVVWIAHDGADAVARCEKDRPDLILMDLFMPQLDGVEATRQIMARTPCAIVIATSKVEDHTGKVFEAMGAGAIDAVSIPVIASGGVGTLDHLVEGIRDGHATAVLAASIFHFGEHSIRAAKEHMARAGLPMRLDP